MITKERQMHIIQRLQQDSFVSVKELVEELHASRSSIVRDLIELENQGYLVRERGGAALKTMSTSLSVLTEVATKQKEHLQEEEKRAICKVAAQSIQDGQCIYIDSGSTTPHLLPYLDHKNITLVTPSVYLIRKLPAHFQGNIFLLGGDYQVALDTSKGSLTQQMIAQFHFDCSFMSANGVDKKTLDVYTCDFELAAMKRAILERSRHCELLVDSTKFETSAIASWATLDQFHTVYVDAYPEDMDMLDTIRICERGE